MENPETSQDATAHTSNDTIVQEVETNHNAIQQPATAEDVNVEPTITITQTIAEMERTAGMLEELELWRAQRNTFKYKVARWVFQLM
ncbi:hypothetical protein HK104_010688 [Borealophlyctis nickersoniae]|nr:hypothetical protein HK104_010688 [Borealophlyctis nickersoniae]